MPDPTKGTVPVAFVTLRTGAGEDAAEQIRARVVGEIGGYARPDRVIVTSAMPKTRTGKTMRRLMREVLLHGEPRSDTCAMEDPGALDTVAAVVKGG